MGSIGNIAVFAKLKEFASANYIGMLKTNSSQVIPMMYEKNQCEMVLDDYTMDEFTLKLVWVPHQQAMWICVGHNIILQLTPQSVEAALST